MKRLLTPRELKVLIARFGLSGDDQKTLREIAATDGVCPERVRRIEGVGLRKLREGARDLQLYLEPDRDCDLRTYGINTSVPENT